MYPHDEQLEFSTILGDRLLVVGHRGSVALYDLETRSRSSFVSAPDPGPHWPFSTGVGLAFGAVWVGFRDVIEGYRLTDLSPVATLGPQDEHTIIGPPVGLSRGRVGVRARLDDESGNRSWGVLSFDVATRENAYLPLAAPPIQALALEPQGDRVAWLYPLRGDQEVELRFHRTNIDSGRDEVTHRLTFRWQLGIRSLLPRQPAAIPIAFALLDARQPGLLSGLRRAAWRRAHAASFPEASDPEEAALEVIDEVVGRVLPAIGWGPNGSNWVVGGDLLYAIDGRGELQGGFRLPKALSPGDVEYEFNARATGELELVPQWGPLVDLGLITPPGPGRIVDLPKESIRERPTAPRPDADVERGTLILAVEALDDSAIADALDRAIARLRELPFLVDKDRFRIELSHRGERVRESQLFDLVGPDTPRAFAATRRLIEAYATECARMDGAPWYDDEVSSLSYAARTLALRGGEAGLSIYRDVYLQTVDLEHDVFHREVLWPALGEAGQALANALGFQEST